MTSFTSIKCFCCTQSQHTISGLQRLACDDSGQDIIEYALVAALVGLATVTGINGIAAKISNAMTAVYTRFADIIAAALK